MRIAAEAAGIEVRTPTRLHGEIEALRQVDWLVVAAYGLLLPEPVLAAPKRHCLNVHASLLPRWRGAAPIEWAIMAGDTETGVSIMQIDAGLDTGPVYSRRSLPLGDDATGAFVAEQLAALGADALLDTLNDLPKLEAIPQDDRTATYAKKLEDADAVIDWTRSAIAIDRQVRALHGRMAAYTRLGDARLRLLRTAPRAGSPKAVPGTLVRRGSEWHVACGDGELILQTVQLSRGKGTPQPVQNIANGYPALVFDGAHLG